MQTPRPEPMYRGAGCGCATTVRGGPWLREKEAVAVLGFFSPKTGTLGEPWYDNTPNPVLHLFI
jgi:hypothetical protein